MRCLCKKILKILFVIILATVLSGCKHDRGLILFNSVPITENNALHDQKIFKSGSKIYYLFIAPKKVQNEYIRVQVFSLTDKTGLGGEDMVRTKDFRLNCDERYYYTDYFTIWEKGRYVMQVFSHDDFTNPLALNYFYVE